MFKTSSISLSLLLGSISTLQIDKHHTHSHFSVGYNSEPFPTHHNHLKTFNAPWEHHVKKGQTQIEPK